VSRIVAFIVKNMDMIIACLIGKLDSSHVEIWREKMKAQMLKKQLGAGEKTVRTCQYMCMCNRTCAYKCHNPWQHSVEADKLFELNEQGIPVDDVCMTRELSFKGDGMSSHKKFAL